MRILSTRRSRFLPRLWRTIARRKVSIRRSKREKESLTIKLEPNQDILATVAKNKGNRLRRWLRRRNRTAWRERAQEINAKNADIIVANDVTAEGAGFDVRYECVTLFSRDGRDRRLPRMSKTEVLSGILDEVARPSLRCYTPQSAPRSDHGRSHFGKSSAEISADSASTRHRPSIFFIAIEAQ